MLKKSKLFMINKNKESLAPKNKVLPGPCTKPICVTAKISPIKTRKAGYVIKWKELYNALVP